MSTLMWVAVAVVSIVVAMMLILGYLRVRKPLLGRKNREQIELNKKMHVISSAPADSSQPIDGPWYGNYLSALLIFVSGFVLYWQYDTRVSPTEVGSWGQSHWLPLLIFAGTLQALIAINAKSLGSFAETVKWLPTGLMVAVLIVLPIIGWATKDVGHAQEQAQLRMLSMPPNGDSARIRAPLGKTSFMGDGFVTRCVYTDGSEQSFPCKPGPMLWVYVHDTSGRPNSVAY